MLRGWGRATGSVADVVRAQAAEHVADVLRAPGRRGVLARGLGRAYGDAAQNAGGRVVDMRGLRGVRDFDAALGTVTVDAGISLGTLSALMLGAGWFPAVVPGTRWVTVGGAIATDVHGKNHHVDGGFTDHVVSLRLVTPDGTARTVARDGDPEAWAATVGGMGLAGVITEATLRLRRVSSALVREEVRRADDLDGLLAAMAQSDRHHRYSVAWVDWTGRGRGLLLQGDHAEAGGDGDGAPRLTALPRFRAPRAVPGRLIGPPVVKAFNALWLAARPRIPHTRLVPAASYFWPLDALRGWNRLYGPRGLVQHQCVVPHGREEVLHAILARCRAARIASALTVLKRLGPANAPLAFPMPGWTLTLDFPAAVPGLDRVLDAVDDDVAAAGGRVYLAKDARLRPDRLAAMYPGLGDWRRLRDRLDPAGVMRSDLGRRLELV
jgi:decaprenylphospho-beta-D-ribofuranose 2-oxidase